MNQKYYIIAGTSYFRHKQTHIDKHGRVDYNNFGQTLPSCDRFQDSFENCNKIVSLLQKAGYKVKLDSTQQFICDKCGITGTLEWEFFTKSHLSFHHCVCGGREFKSVDG